MDWTAKEMGFDFQQGQEIFLFFTASRLALKPTQPTGIRVYISRCKAGEGIKTTT
jgi:hypothetical protein